MKKQFNSKASRRNSKNQKLIKLNRNPTEKNQQNLYKENQRTLMNEIEELYKQRDIPSSWIELAILSRCQFSPTYKFKTITIKISGSYFVDIRKLTLKFIWRGKRPSIDNKVFKKKYGG